MKLLAWGACIVAVASCGGGTAKPDGSDVRFDGAVVTDGPQVDAPPEQADSEGFVATGNGWSAPNDGFAVEADGTVRIVGGAAQEPNAAIRLQTTRLAFAGNEITALPTTISQIDSQQLVLHRPNVDERLTENEDGLHQQWEFAAPMTTDVVVEVTATGADQISQDEGGVFITSATLAAVHYGTATWVDNAGVRTPVTTEVVGATLRMTVPAAVVAASQFPAKLDPTLGAETVTDAAVNGPSGALSQMPAVAYSGSNYLVVWRDDRNGRNSDIYGMRISTAGAVLDSAAFAISTSAGVQSNPTVTFVNGNYLVAWEDFKLPAADADLRAARVTTGGTVTQLGVVAATTAAETKPKLGVRGTAAMLVYEQAGTVRGTLYNGTTFGATFAIAAAGTTPAVAANPAGDYLVAFADTTDVKAQLVSSAGAMVGTVFPISAAAGAQTEPAVTFGGGNFAVAFTSASNIFGTRVSTAGVVLDTRTENAAVVGGISLVTAASVQQHPSLVCGTECLLVWQDRRNSATYFDVYSKVLTTALAGVSAESVVASAGGVQGQFEPVAVLAGTAYLAVWRDQRDAGAGYVYSTRISSAGAALDAGGVLLARGANRQSSPRASRNSTRWLLTWGDSRVAGDDIHAARVRNGGSILSTTTVSAATQQQQQPGTSWDGANHIVAWSDARNGGYDIYAARVTTNGVTLDTNGILITNAANDQFLNDVESGANRTLIVWQDRHGTTGFDVYGAILNSTGGIAVAPFAIAAATGDQNAASVAFDSTNNVFVVVWQDSRAGANERDIYAARVSTTGTVLDAAGILVSAATSSQLTPDIAFGNGRFMTVWDDRRSGNADIYGARLRISGGALLVDDAAGIQYTTNTAKQTAPSVAFTSQNNNASGFVTAWSDERNLATTGTDIYGNIINSTTGAILAGGASGFVISTNAGDEGNPTICAGNRGNTARALVSYQRFFAGSTMRVVSRRLLYTEI